MSVVQNHVLETSALGAYWKRLRRAANLSQEQLTDRLKQVGLSTSPKQVWGWEKGVSRPSALSKARVDQMLGGNALVSDALLLFDDDNTKQIMALQAILTETGEAATQHRAAEEELTTLTPTQTRYSDVQTILTETAEAAARHAEASAQLQAIAAEARRRGEQAADEALLGERLVTELRQQARAIPRERLDRALAILSDLEERAPEHAEDFLTYGEYMVQRSERGR